MIPEKMIIVGIVNKPAIINNVAPILSIGVKNEKIITTKMNPDKIPTKIAIKCKKAISLINAFPNKANIHKVINNIKMNTNKYFFDKLFNPLMNLMRNSPL